METGVQIPSWLVTLIISLLVASITGGASWVLIRPQKRKVEAGAAESLTQTAMVLLARYKVEYEQELKRISLLEDKLEKIQLRLSGYEETFRNSERYIEYLQRGIAILVAQICRLGYTPNWIVSDSFMGTNEDSEE